ncbi:MAG: T9SS type A sorting domain-containing protein [Saprospiraceae bacterium]|nr:T9SS type A sorting domain-containing protein [Lewinella sp.]
MKYLFFLLIMVHFPSVTFGQGAFAPIGAKWNFTSDDEIVLSTSLKDSLLQGRVCRMIKTDTYNRLNNQLIKQDSLFVFEQNDSVYYFNMKYKEFLLLYDFTAAEGDTLGFIAPVDKDSFFMVVDSIVVTTHNDQPVKYFHVSRIDPYGWHFAPFGGIWVAQVGSVHTLFLPESGERVAISFPILVCYQNEKNDSFTFPEFSTYDCQFDIVDATNNPIGEASKVSIFPNPAANLIRIRLNADAAISFPVSYQLFSLNGASILIGQVSKKEWTLDLSGLSSGIYVLKLTDPKNDRYCKKVMIR